jgi:radical SAM superfamily enzyme YgiQ (UPF0313 family)
MPRPWVKGELLKVAKTDAVLVTSLMTYWYPGVKEAIGLARECHPGTPVILGGIYARLCAEHALQSSGADFVVSATGDEALSSTLRIMEQCGVLQESPFTLGSESPYPAFDMLREIDYVCLLTSTGCPYRCRYCASRFLNPLFSRREPQEVVEEILHWHRGYGVLDFAFYDDALLADSQKHLSVLLESLIRKNLTLRFHTPNALHVREIDAETAHLLYRSGFRTIRLGLETSDETLHRAIDQKVSAGEFERAVKNLKTAGFRRHEIGAYVLMGLPGQSLDTVSKTVELVDEVGAIPYLAEYSPLPHTPMWEKAVSCSRYDLSSEPLYHNNSLLPCWDDSQIARIPELKKRVLEIRRKNTIK